MSLLDAFLEDGLYNPPVVTQDVWLAIRTDDATGSGTALDPYNAKSQALFDGIMSTKMAANTTIHLGPGLFQTKGNQTGGWKILSGVRLVGSGQSATTLQLVNHQASALNVAIGMDYTSSADFLDGCEISDLSIDANLPNGNTAAGGIAVSGRNIYIHDVRVKNFGSVGASAIPCVVIAAARAYVSLPQAVSNCVVERCVLDTPSGYNSSTTAVTGILLSGEMVSGAMYYHTACVVRDCLIDFASGGTADFSKNYRGITANGGVGTMVEGNAVRNCYCAYYASNSVASPSVATQETKDLILRGNYFYNVLKGIHQEYVNAKWQLGRIIVQKNVIEMAVLPTLSSLGIKLDGHSNSPNPFLMVIVRANTIRHVDGAAGYAGTMGLSLNGCQAANVEQNLIDVNTANESINHDSTVKVNTFYNQSSAGVFLPAYNTTTALHDRDLVTDVEDVILSF